MIDWTVEPEYEVGEGWRYEATADVEGLHVIVYGEFRGANTMGRPVDVELQNDRGDTLAIGAKHGARAEDIPDLVDALMGERQYPEEAPR